MESIQNNIIENMALVQAAEYARMNNKKHEGTKEYLRKLLEDTEQAYVYYAKLFKALRNI